MFNRRILLVAFIFTISYSNAQDLSQSQVKWVGDSTDVPQYLINTNINSEAKNESLNIELSHNSLQLSNEIKEDSVNESFSSLSSVDLTKSLLDPANEIQVIFQVEDKQNISYVYLDLVFVSDKEKVCYSEKLSLSELDKFGFISENEINIGLNTCFGPGEYKVQITIENSLGFTSSTSSKSILL